MATKTEALNLLKSVPLFEGLSKAELSQVLGHLREEWFATGEDIVRADDASDRFYVITEGRAKVLVKGKSVRTIGPGGYFGEMALLDGSPRSATVRAETQVHTLWLGRLAFLGLLEDNWKMTRKVLADLCGRIRVYDRDHTA
jgi:CRP/FNR family transcriptional regulator, cyclic AMP receptor protein